jgi:hypothetical protein
MPVTNTEINVKRKVRCSYPFFVDKPFLVGVVSKSNSEIPKRNMPKKEGFTARVFVYVTHYKRSSYHFVTRLKKQGNLERELS